MKLINIKTSQALIEFRDKQTIIYNKFLEQEMNRIGIPIPHGSRSLYQGKDYIYLDDPDFQKAFKEIYYLTIMNPQQFHWID
ncbi:MAG: hypothetical protein R3E91_00135 [Chlamydiales bacterium]